MPPSAIHMDLVRAKTLQLHHAAHERQAGAVTESATVEPAAKAEKSDKGEGMSFWDVLDVVNPLQHIPGVNKIYQAITGDTIRTPAKIAGAALFFGPVGMALASADAVLEKETGKDAMDHVASVLGLEKDAPAEVPAEDDPFTVTAPRPVRTAEAAQVPQDEAAAAPLPQPGQPVDLSAGQAALLEQLMNGGGQALPTVPAAAATIAAPAQAAPVPAAVTPTSVSAHAPAAGGIATARQLKDLESTPGASAALTAARGMGSAAVVASLPAPGAAGAGDNLLAAMEQDQQRSRGANTGKGLAEYRAAAISSGSMQVKPIVAAHANQMARSAGANMPGANVAPHSAMTTRTVQPKVATATPAAVAAPVESQPAAAQPVASSMSVQQPAAWPPGGPAPLPKELIADMMSRAMDKYEAQGRGTAPAASGTVH